MLLVSYDIADNKLRTHFSKFLKKFGYRLQYSVFQIDNSDRILKVIMSEINQHYKDKFTEADSVIIFRVSDNCEVVRYGYARNEEKDLIIV